MKALRRVMRDPCKACGGRGPAVLRDEITCATCKLCAVGHRKSIVGFPAHGDSKGQVTQRLRQLPMFTGAHS